MKAVVQRVKKARVLINGEVFSAIGQGMLILLGIHQDDTEKTAVGLSEKILKLRIFPSSAEKNIDKSILDTRQEILVVSQFTLIADTQKGNRPSFIHAAEAEKAKRIYSKFVEHLRQSGLKVKTGKFGAMMEVSLVNDGPVTIILETTKKA